MKDNKINPFEIDFDSYIRQSEPEKQENGKLWQTAIGLQQVDGLTPSKYLYETANADMIRQTLEYDFGQEKAFDYSTLSKEEAVKHLTRFIANIWQIHPFGEGNTRSTAVFTIKYLNSLGFEVNNEPFEKNSWYFRNALVRANYTNINKGIYMNTEYLEKFFRNLLLGEHNELKNRYCHIRYTEQSAAGSEKKFGEKQKSSEKTSERILALVKENPRLSAKKLSELLGISSRAVEKQIASLEDKGRLKREGSPKGGHWEVL